MESKNLEIMSEFVMAAMLINIKPVYVTDSTEEDEEEIDPRQELVDRLLEHKMYKYVSGSLGTSRRMLRVMFKPPSIPIDCEGKGNQCRRIGQDLTLSKLLEISPQLLKTVKKIDRLEVNGKSKEEINLGEVFIQIQKFSMEHKVFYFRNLWNNRLLRWR